MTKEYKIAEVKLESPYLMAPLAGVTDAPTRLLYSEMGASLVYSEMISAKGLYYGDRKSDILLHILPEEKKVAYQLFGSDPNIMAHAVRMLEDRPNVLIDVNMGCPVPKVFKNGDGSALMRDPDLVYRIVKSMVAETAKPVTGKIRLGISDKDINCVEVAQALESGGAAAVTVHGRTREQYYSGEADWSAIGEVRRAVGIPVIANGDVTDPSTATAIRQATGCDMVMIGRGALGRPWLFRELQGGEPADLPEKKSIMKRHFSGLIELKGQRVAINEMRKHIGWYTKGMTGSSKIRGILSQLDTVEKIISLIDGLE